MSAEESTDDLELFVQHLNAWPETMELALQGPAGHEELRNRQAELAGRVLALCEESPVRIRPVARALHVPKQNPTLCDIAATLDAAEDWRKAGYEMTFSAFLGALDPRSATIKMED